MLQQSTLEQFNSMSLSHGATVNAYVNLQAKNPDTALRYAQYGLMVCENAGLSYQAAWMHGLIAMIYSSANHQLKARTHITHLEKCTDQCAFPELQLHLYIVRAFPELQLHLYIVRAWYALHHGKTPELAKRLREWLEFAQAKRMYSGYMHWFPDIIQRLCEKCVKLKIHSTALVKILSHIPNADVSHVQVPRLRIQILNQCKISIDGKTLEFSRQTPRKLLELLAYVILSGGRCRASKLIDALWPDIEGDKAYRSLLTSLHRLRKLLQVDVLIHQGGHISIDRTACIVDLWEMEELCKQVESNSVNSQQLTSLADEINQLYGKPFTQDLPTGWSIAHGAKIKSRYIDTIEIIVKQFMSRREYNFAINILNQCVEIRNEQLFNLLIENYMLVKKYERGLNAFKHHQIALDASTTSTKLQQLHQELLQKVN